MSSDDPYEKIYIGTGHIYQIYVIPFMTQFVIITISHFLQNSILRKNMKFYVVDLNCYCFTICLASFQNMVDSETKVLENVPERIERETDEETEGSSKVGDQRDKCVTVNLINNELMITSRHLK